MNAETVRDYFAGDPDHPCCWAIDFAPDRTIEATIRDIPKPLRDNSHAAMTFIACELANLYTEQRPN